ncbi:type III secretion system protein PrgJ [Iodobacter ciconiae]|uniref:Type III secretion system protein PrgJ n=1 Tax=Iodobacter ciconiae TaxID=2496266 RepID=A0A3S8ZX75_9NEIS|nr:type III secretion system protein PrgJ [Iodobacter ciconiae]
MGSHEDGLISLDDRLLHAYAQSTAATENDKKEVMQILSQPGLLSDPATLFELQMRTSNYNLDVSMISTLTRKAVGAVESLLRS